MQERVSCMETTIIVARIKCSVEILVNTVHTNSGGGGGGDDLDPP